jgi:hypothetical protein
MERGQSKDRGEMAQIAPIIRGAYRHPDGRTADLMGGLGDAGMKLLAWL